MLKRAYSAKFHARQPSYINCTVAEEWFYFSAFREWMKVQKWQGNALDKDLLHPGNNVYSPDKCVFITPCINNFLTDHGARRGNWPIGVHFHKSSGKYQADCCNPFMSRSEYLGIFDDPEEAHEAWRAKKHEYACRYADMQTDQRVANALRTRYAKKEDNT